MKVESRETISIGHWVTRNPITAEKGTSVRQVVGKMNEQHISAVPIMNHGRLVGIFTERDLLSVVSHTDGDGMNEPVSRFMTPEPITAKVQDDYNIVFMLMKLNDVSHLPVMDQDELIGIVSIRDLTHFYQNKLESEFADAREKIDELKRLIHLSADEVLDSLFAEITKYKELSLTDHLTGLYNKRYFVMRLQEEIARANRYKQNLALIFCDIDHFKTINDNYGHHCGDIVLRTLGQTLAGGMGEIKVLSRLRKSDIVARYGGEEFVVILPETSLEHASVAAEKMRKLIESMEVTAENVQLHLTMSFGVAPYGDGVESGEELIQRADFAMYKAKQGGRNRVVGYTGEK